jgi:hypothetical protein
MIEGLLLTMTGDELLRLLDSRVEAHRRGAARWQRELSRTADQQTEEEPLLPEHMCENEAERCEWRAEVLEFIRDHVDPSEVYRLGQADLEFGELLPPKPGWMEQDEYEERTRVGFQLERLTKRIGPIGVLMQRDPEAK